jgi:hypothetical protein
MADWIQIDPALTPGASGGAFVALASLPRANELKPIPPDPNATAFGIRFDDGSAYNFSAAVQLGLGNIADDSANFKTQTFIHDRAYYAQGVSSAPNGGLIYGTYWGAGMRVRVNVTDYTAKAQLSLANIAAAASIGLVNASFSIEGLGIADLSVFKLLPGPGRFDEDSLKKILQAMQDVEDNLLKPKKNLVAVPFMIFVSNRNVTFGNAIQRGKSQLFAIRRIKEGLQQDEAIAAAARANVDPIVVETIYSQWARTTAATPKPDADAIRRATDWLKVADLN